MSHRGSILCLPSGVWTWDATADDVWTDQRLAGALAEAGELAVLLVGTGALQVFPPPQLRARFEDKGCAFETMATGAAARTYNILLAEQRRVGAALLAVD